MLTCLLSLHVASSLTIALGPVCPASSREVCVPIATAVQVDTGSTSPTVLTVELLAPYAAVEKTLWPYLIAHEALLTQLRRIGSQGVTRNGMTLSLEILDYADLVRRDTTMATLFAEHHVDPAQFGQTQTTVWHAIWAALDQQAADTATVTGRNVAFVQTHRPELATDWTRMQKMQKLADWMRSQTMHAAQQQSQQQSQP